MKRQPRLDWSDHFSVDAADLMRIAYTLAGFDHQEILLRCFNKITVPTVESVLQELSDESKTREKALLAEMEQR